MAVRGAPAVSARRLTALMRRFAETRLLVVGDVMLDRFVWGEVERISPEAPVPVVRVVSDERRLGGAANVAANLRGLGARVAAAAVVGEDEAGSWITASLGEMGVSTRGVFRDPVARTTEKHRIMGLPRPQQLARLDYEDAAGPSEETLRRLARFTARQASVVDGIVVSDYGKGVVAPALLELAGDLARDKGVLVVVDPKRANYEHYRDVALVTPNKGEAAEASGVAVSDRVSLRKAGRRLLEKWRCEAILVTLGEDGMSLFRRDGSVRHFPTTARAVFDVTGAGDTVVAVSALALAAGGSREEAATLANLAAGLVVGGLGTTPVEARQLRAAIREDV